MLGDLGLGDEHCDRLRLTILMVVVVTMVVATVCLLMMRRTMSKNLVLEGGHADHADSGDPCIIPTFTSVSSPSMLLSLTFR